MAYETWQDPGNKFIGVCRPKPKYITMNMIGSNHFLTHFGTMFLVSKYCPFISSMYIKHGSRKQDRLIYDWANRYALLSLIYCWSLFYVADQTWILLSSPLMKARSACIRYPSKRTKLLRAKKEPKLRMSSQLKCLSFTRWLLLLLLSMLLRWWLSLLKRPYRVDSGCPNTLIILLVLISKNTKIKEDCTETASHHQKGAWGNESTSWRHPSPQNGKWKQFLVVQRGLQSHENSKRKPPRIQPWHHLKKILAILLLRKREGGMGEGISLQS